MKKKLDHRDAVARKVALETIDIFKTFLPDMFGYKLRGHSFILQNLRMNPDNQHLLVIRPVENPDLPSSRQAARGSPEEIMFQLFRRRRFEGPDVHAFRINAGHYVLDG